MAQLTAEQKKKVANGIMRWLSQGNVPIDPTYDELVAAIDATDAWIDTNAAAFNLALPVAARNKMTAAQKTLIFCIVAAMRVSPDFTRRLVGEID